MKHIRKFTTERHNAILLEALKLLLAALGAVGLGLLLNLLIKWLGI